MRMRRRLYLSALLILQLALIVELAPPLARAFSVDSAVGMAPAGWPAILQLVATGAAVAGTSLALIFPGVALSRHRRGGALRFLGLPRWAVTLTLIGVVALAAGALVLMLLPVAPIHTQLTAALIARPVVAGGLALTTAGVLCAELMRRNPAPATASTPMAHRRSGRVEVTHPPELRTRGG
jgi:hypothetical protein